MARYEDYKRTINKYNVYCFNNIYELVNLTKEYVGKSLNGGKQSEGRKDGYNDSFYECENIDEALNKMEKGWDFAIDKLNKGMNNINYTTKNTFKHDVVGFTPCVPRYLNGIPTNMVRQVKEQTKEKVIILNRPINVNGGVSVDEIIRYATTFMTIVNKLESEGYKVGINILTMTFDGSNPVISTKLCVKKPSERLNIAKISFACCNPDYQRRIQFKLRENVPECDKIATVYGGYGRSCEYYYNSPDKIKNAYMNIINKGEYYIPLRVEKWQLDDDIFKVITKKN